MFIGAFAALGLVMAVIYLARATPLYTATTQVLLEVADQAPMNNSQTNFRFMDRSFIENQLAILTSDSLLRRVVIKERLAVPPPSATDAQSAQDGLHRRKPSPFRMA